MRTKTKAQLLSDIERLSEEVKTITEERDKMKTLLENMRSDPHDKTLDVMVNAKDVILKLEKMEQLIFDKWLTVNVAGHLIERVIEAIKSEAKDAWEIMQHEHD